MVQHVQLNNIDHRNLRIRRGYSVALGDATMLCPVFPYEFRNLQPHYPIVFSKDSTSGGVRPFALFGLEEAENLFLTDEGGWDADYIPLAMRIQPFLIGFARPNHGDAVKERAEGKRDDHRMEVHIDLDHPRVIHTAAAAVESHDRASSPDSVADTVADADSVAVFLPHGGQSPYLQEIAKLLGDIDDGEQSITSFSALLTEMELLEPFALEVTLEDGTCGRLAGYYILAEETLYSLGASALENLQTTGFLQPIYMTVAALSQFRGLIDRRNHRNRLGHTGRMGRMGRMERMERMDHPSPPIAESGLD